MRTLVITGAAFLLSGCSTMDAHEPDHVVGIWGGAHAGLQFSGGLADAQFDCASGTIDEVVRPLGPEGAFSAKGTYREGISGPVKVGQIYRSQEATYAGTIAKAGKGASRVMTLGVALDDGSKVGPFTLTEGLPPQVTRCR